MVCRAYYSCWKVRCHFSPSTKIEYCELQHSNSCIVFVSSQCTQHRLTSHCSRSFVQCLSFFLRSCQALFDGGWGLDVECLSFFLRSCQACVVRWRSRSGCSLCEVKWVWTLVNECPDWAHWCQCWLVDGQPYARAEGSSPAPSLSNLNERNGTDDKLEDMT